jgi:DNA-binding MarR family transcriptional regulator
MAVNRVSTTSARGEEVSRDEVGEVLRLFVNVITGLKRGRSEVPNKLRDAFESGGLGPRHVPVLMAVAFGDPLSVGEIAERIGLSLATTSLMVGELDRQGIVVRAEDERDRRRTIVRLHEDHRAIVDAWSVERSSPVLRALQRMSPTVRRHFLDGLSILAAEAQAGDVPDEAAAADC